MFTATAAPVLPASAPASAPAEAREALDFLTRAMPSERALVLVRSADGRKLQVAGVSGLDPARLKVKGEVSFRILRRAAEGGEAVLLGDAAGHQDYQENASVVIASLRSVLCVPFRDAEGRVLGVLYADNRRRAGAFTQAHLAEAVRFAESFGRRFTPKSAANCVEVVAPRARPRVAAAASATPAPATRIDFRPVRGRAAAGAVAATFRSLATLVSSGVLVHRAFGLLAQGDDRVMNRVCKRVALRLMMGQTVSKAMAAHPEAFSTVHVQMVALGESTGNLDGVLRRLADLEERRRALQMRMQSGLLYPAFLLVVCLLALLLAPPFLLEPNFRLLRDLGVEPPALTRGLMFLADSMRQPGTWVGGLLALVLAGAAYARAWRTPAFRGWWAETLLRVPRLGAAFRSAAVARFATAYAAQMECGMEVCRALTQAAAVSGNPVLTRNISKAVKALQEGEDLPGSLQACEFFPNTVIEFVRSGEVCGQVPKMMGVVAESAEQDVNSSLETAAALAEPLVMVVMGLLAALLVLGTMLPMIQALDIL